MGIPLMIGCMLGEASAGWISDILLNGYAKRHGGYRNPEARLFLLPLCITASIGIIMFGVVIQLGKPWIAAAVCMGVAGYGLQVGTTMTYTYTTDSYRHQSAEISAIINVYRFVYAFTVAFYALPSTVSLNFGGAFGLLGGINCALLLLVGVFIFKGESIREKQGIPDIHKDL